MRSASLNFLVALLAVAAALPRARADDPAVPSPAQDVSVRFDDGTTSVCQFSHLSVPDADHAPVGSEETSYACPDPGGSNHGTGGILLTRSQTGNWHALRLTADGKISAPEVRSVAHGETILYGVANDAAEPRPTSLDLNTEGSRLTLLNTALFAGGTQNSSRPRLAALTGSRWSKEFAQLYPRVKSASLARAAAIDAALAKTPVVDVDFGDGVHARCRRGTRSSRRDPLPPHALPEACELFRCDPVTVAGKRYEVLLNLPSEAGLYEPAQATLMSDDGPGPVLLAQSVVGTASHATLFRQASGPPPLPYPGLPQGMVIDPLFQAAMSDQDFLPTRANVADHCASKDVLDQFRREKAWIAARQRELDQQDLVAVVENFDDTLRTLFMPRSQLPDDACHLIADNYVTSQAQARFTAAEPARGDPYARAVSPQVADRLFREAAAMTDIPYRYTQDGCYARAAVLCDRLAQAGYACEKIWAKGGMLQPSADLRWKFHVAPAIWVHEDDGSYRRRIIDPSLEDHAATPDEWLAKFWSPAEQGRYLHVRWPTPLEDSPYHRTVMYYTPPDIYLPEEMAVPDAAQHAADEVAAQRTLETYMEYQRQMDQPTPKKSGARK